MGVVVLLCPGHESQGRQYASTIRVSTGMEGISIIIIIISQGDSSVSRRVSGWTCRRVNTLHNLKIVEGAIIQSYTVEMKKKLEEKPKRSSLIDSNSYVS